MFLVRFLHFFCVFLGEEECFVGVQVVVVVAFCMCFVLVSC